MDLIITGVVCLAAGLAVGWYFETPAKVKEWIAKRKQ